MFKSLAGPGAQIFAIAIMSAAAGANLTVAVGMFLEGKPAAWLYALVTVVFCGSITANSIRFRRTIPASPVSASAS